MGFSQTDFGQVFGKGGMWASMLETGRRTPSAYHEALIHACQRAVQHNNSGLVGMRSPALLLPQYGAIFTLYCILAAALEPDAIPAKAQAPKRTRWQRAAR